MAIISQYWINEVEYYELTLESFHHLIALLQ